MITSPHLTSNHRRSAFDSPVTQSARRTMGMSKSILCLLLVLVSASVLSQALSVEDSLRSKFSSSLGLETWDWRTLPEVQAVKTAQLQHLRNLDKIRHTGGSSYVDERGFVHERGPTDVISCSVCKFLVMVAKNLVQRNRTQADAGKVGTAICIFFRIEDARVCPLIVKQYQGMVLSVATRMLLTPDTACGLLTDGRCGTPPTPSMLWNLTLPDTPKPPITPPKPPQPGSPQLRVLHLTDLHLDLQYEPGTKVECGEPLCCRANDGLPDANHTGAGQWGSYNHCDLPHTFVENMFQHLATIKDQFDVVYFTGDIPAHDVWNQTRSAQLSHLALLMSYFRKYLPGVPVYNSLGNHESSPCNSFPPPWVEDEHSIGWLYGALTLAWGKWLPASTTPTILRGGFYTFSPFPGFRIVALNFNFCASLNWWLLVNSTDPAGQLQWLMDVLQSAEDAGEKVHILGHHPPGSCMQAWNWNYNRIVDRYESTITGQFYGHTHKDSYQVFYDNATLKRPTNVAYIGGSVTTYNFLNPGFRIYDVDGNYTGSSWAILDYTHYIADLSKANNHSQPVWQKEYSPKEAYNMKSLYPADWNDLIYRMRDNTTLFYLFRRYRYKMVDHGACGEACRFAELCNLKSARSFTPKLCSDLVP